MSINSEVIRLHQEWHRLPLVPRTCGERCDFDTIAEFVIGCVHAEAVAKERQRITALLGDLRPIQIAIADPGAYLQRGDGEPVPRWSARAVCQVLSEMLAAGSGPVAPGTLNKRKTDD